MTAAGMAQPGSSVHTATTTAGLRLLNLSRNFGHQTAITAGMDHAAGAAVIIIDADLQDPPEIIPQMTALWETGYEVVYGRRISRQGETVLKKCTAHGYYWLLQHLTEVDIPADVGDFRLIDAPRPGRLVSGYRSITAMFAA